AGDDREQVVEVVGYAARQPADGFELLRLAELLFQSAALGDVAEDEHRPDLLAALADRRRGVLDREGGAVLAPELLVVPPAGGVGGQGVADVAVAAGVGPLGQGGQVLPEQLARLVTQQPQPGRVDEGDPALKVDAADALA